MKLNCRADQGLFDAGVVNAKSTPIGVVPNSAVFVQADYASIQASLPRDM
jgi:hypothetical protein